jgi:hypothetical protein
MCRIPARVWLRNAKSDLDSIGNANAWFTSVNVTGGTSEEKDRRKEMREPCVKACVGPAILKED